MPKLIETAELRVGGSTFKDWKTVLVYVEYGQALREFEFTTAERDNMSPSWETLRVKPGDSCQIFLAGQLAITGYVNLRHVHYNATTHTVTLKGRGLVQDLHDSQILQKVGQFRGYNWEQIAKKIVDPFKIQLQFTGGGDANKPFDDVQKRPGESPFNFLDRLGRMRGIYLNENEKGNLVATSGGQGGGGSGDTLTEGQNIKEANCVIKDDNILSPTVFQGQENGTDKKWARDVTSNWYKVEDSFVKRYRPSLIMSPRSSTIEDLKTHAAYELAWRASVEVDCYITKYSWLRSGGQLWDVNLDVTVNSPMLILKMPLKTKAVTFTQTPQGGTETTLRLCKPQGLGAPMQLGSNPVQ